MKNARKKKGSIPCWVQLHSYPQSYIKLNVKYISYMKTLSTKYIEGLCVCEFKLFGSLKV